MKLKDLIKKLEELNDDDFTISFRAEPEVYCYETWLGEGTEETKYIYEITLTENKTHSRKYKNVGGIRRYKEENKE